MNIISKYILPRFKTVANLIAQNPDRDDLGFVDLPMLVAVIMVAVILSDGSRRGIIAYATRLTNHSNEDVTFLIDQYSGKDETRHLWRRNADGGYSLLL